MVVKDDSVAESGYQEEDMKFFLWKKKKATLQKKNIWEDMYIHAFYGTYLLYNNNYGLFKENIVNDI